MTTPKTDAELHPTTTVGFFSMFTLLWKALSHLISSVAKTTQALDELADIPLNSIPHLSRANDAWLTKLVEDAQAQDAEDSTTPDPE
jgi:hypothetical protein